MHQATIDTAATKALYQQWMAMWSGNLALGDVIFGENCGFHTSSPANEFGAALQGPEGATLMVQRARAIMPDAQCVCDLGPIVEGAMLAARWSFTGTYAGGMPGATAAAGSPLAIQGTDMWRLEDGQVAKCWISSDMLPFLAQLGITQL